MRRGWTLWLALVAMVMWTLTACSDDGGGGGGGGTDAGADGGTDAGGTDTGGTDTGGPEVTTCPGGATACRGNNECLATEFCNTGCCEERPVAENCARTDQECTSDAWSNDTFVCALPEGGGVGACLNRCDSLATGDDENGCPIGNFCFEIDDVITNETTGAILDGACFEGDCNDVCFEEGDGCALSDLFTCADGAGTCYGFGNGANFCITAGTQGVDEDCIPGAGEAGETCASGLLCYQGQCVEPCSFGSAKAEQCGGADTCVPVFDVSGDNQPGVCTTECDAYSEGQCGEGRRCDPNIGPYTGQLRPWTCIDMEDGLPVRGYLETCDATEGPVDQCGPGLVCVPSPLNDGTGRCEQLCDPSGDITEDFGSCPAGEGEPLFGDETLTPEGSVRGYDEVASGSLGRPTIVDASGPGASGGNLVLDEGTANTFIAHVQGGGYGMTAFEDDAITVSGDSAIEVYNVSGVALDVFAELEATDGGLAPGATSPEASVDAGIGYESVGSDEWQYIDLGAEAGDAYDVVVMGADGEERDIDSAFYALDPPDLTGDEAAVQIINAAVTPTDIFADWGDGLDDNDGAVDYGTASEWFVVDTSALTGDLDIELKDTDSAGSVALALAETLAAGDVARIILWDDDGTLSSVTLGDFAAIDDEGLNLRVTNGSDLAAAQFFVAAPLLTGIDVGTGAVAEGLVAASMDLVFSDENASKAVGDAPFGALAVTTTVDEVLTIVAALTSEDGDFYGVSNSAPAVDTGSITAGNAAVRFINAADGAGGLRIDIGGGALQICVELAIDDLGRCFDPCTPYQEDSGCPDTGNIVHACIGYLYDNSEVYLGPIEGFCIPRDANVADGGAGTTCDSDAVCDPKLFCVNTGDGPVCSPLCRPFSGDAPSGCGLGAAKSDLNPGGVCLAAVAGDGSTSQVIGICIEPDAIGALEGDSCLPTDQICDHDDGICIALQAGDECVRLCRVGDEASCPLEGTTCSRAGLNPALEPAWLAICQ